MAKIQMKTPLVEMDGDEMTRILWKIIKVAETAPHIDPVSEHMWFPIRDILIQR